MTGMRAETDSMGDVNVPADKRRRARTQRSLHDFPIGKDLGPREVVDPYAVPKKACARANLAGTPVESTKPVHFIDHVSMSQSSNDNFTSAMCIAAAVGVTWKLLPAAKPLHDAMDAKAKAWAGGFLEMNVCKPLTIFDLMGSIMLLSDGCTDFRTFMVEGTTPNLKTIGTQLERSLMLVTAIAPVIGYDKASQIAHHATEHDLTLEQAALQLGYVTEAERDRIADPAKILHPNEAS